MFGSEDKFKKFNDDVASFLKKRYEEEAEKNNANLPKHNSKQQKKQTKSCPKQVCLHLKLKTAS